MQCSALQKGGGPGEYSAVGPTLWLTSYFLTARDTPIIDETDGGPVYGVQCAVCSEKMQSEVGRVQCAVLLCTVCSLQCAEYIVQCAVLLCTHF